MVGLSGGSHFLVMPAASHCECNERIALAEATKSLMSPTLACPPAKATSNTDSLAQCQSHCDALSCTCFDYKPTGQASTGGTGIGGDMDRCRVSRIKTVLTPSSIGYTAYMPVIPPPPPPPQLKTTSVTCVIGASGSATASMSSRGEAHCA